MTPSPAQHGRDEGSAGYETEPEKLISEKNDETILALIRGIHDLDRLLTWQEAASKLGRTGVQLKLTERREELTENSDPTSSDTSTEAEHV